jgi:2-hydroxychromene-2-carboxylate isomerase
MDARTIDYFWVAGSPWTYLGHERAVALARRHGARLRLLPFDLGRVFGVSGGVPLAKRAPQRQAYRLVELARWRDALGVPLNVQPEHFPAPGDAAARMTILALARHGDEPGLRLAGAFNRAVWAEERDLGDEAALASIADACGLPGAALLAEQAGAEAQSAYDANTQAAIERGVFGAPWYVWRDEPFWGQDRLDLLERAVASGGSS